MLLLGILTYILHLDNKANCKMKTNFITVVFNEAPHGYSKAAIWANAPVHAIQMPWRRVAVDLLLLVLRPTTTWWAIAMLLLLLLLLLSGSGHKHTICLFSNVHKAKSLFQLKPYYQYWLISAPCYATQEAHVPGWRFIHIIWCPVYGKYYISRVLVYAKDILLLMTTDGFKHEKSS